MLVILYGSTVEMGKKSRQYFLDHGFEYIQKYNYIPDDFALQSRFGERQKSSKEEVLDCDFVYENNGMLVGFHKKQIIDAVRGRKKCLLTMSSQILDFIQQIKSAYGDYVTVIGTYIDDRTLKKMFEALPGVTPEEQKRRIETGVKIKKSIITDRKLFDHIVMYGGKDSPFNYEALNIQYDYILERAERREKELNNKMYVEMPYTGGENYIFVSYSHADTPKVFPILHTLQFAGYRVWYDEGIQGGENWRKIIASKIQDTKCKDFLVFSSEHSIESRHVKAEINLALNLNKKITTVRLDSATFDMDLEMYLTNDHYLVVRENRIFDEEIIRAMDDTTRVSG